MNKVVIYWRHLVNVRLNLINLDSIETDRVSGFRINRDHLKKVMEARNFPVDEQLPKIWNRNF